MKPIPVVFKVVLVAWFAPVLGLASSYGPAIIEQPINLGPKSDPGKIPLGNVAVVCNYDYGLHQHIGSSRPCPDGAMRWETGTELDQNLASVFGITVEPEDPTQIREFPVVMRIKSWKPPGYSPYTKEQVLAASLWCLVRRVGGTPERPLVIKVVADSHDDKPLEAKYSGKYITESGSDKKPVPPVKVPGTTIEVDARGIAWVVFSEVVSKPSPSQPPPVMTLVETGGESDSGWYLIPEWRNGIDGHEDPSHSVNISFPNSGQEALAAEILALVISAQPTESHPLTVTLRFEEYGLANFPAYRRAREWIETRHDPHNITLECEFVWDAAAHKLTKGFLPLVELDSTGQFINLLPDEPSISGDAKELADAVHSRISNGLHDGTLLAEKNMANDMLADAGLRRQIGLAGYYEALATFYQESGVTDKPTQYTFQFKNSEFDQLHHMGWTIGMNRAQAMVIEEKKKIEEAKRKQGE